jgi:HD-GYP domain-containing protein (c-di-GMP phosphodiesterase class II)
VLERTLRLADGHRHLVRAVQAVLEASEGTHAGIRRGHGARVARFAWRIGDALALPEGRLRELEVAASLHDVGKIGLAQLSGASSEHAAWGAALLETATPFAHLAPAVRHHHDRWDGRGNPGGLSREDLPLAARIIAVCSALDHLTSPAEGPARSLPDAIAEIQRSAGTVYDPSVADALRRAYPVS